MDDTRADDAVDARQLALAVIEQSIDQGPVGIACSRVDDHAAGLIDDDDVLIFIDDIQGDVLRDHLIFFLEFDDSLYLIAFVEAAVGLGFLTVDGDFPALNELLGITARNIQGRRQIDVQPLSLFLFCDY